MMFGEPKVDFRNTPYIQRVEGFKRFNDLMNRSELGWKFTQCVTQCGGNKSDRWNLYHMYVDWHKKALARIRIVEQQHGSA